MKNIIAISAVAALAGSASAAVFELPLQSSAAPLNNGAQVETGGLGTQPFFMNAQGNDDSFAEFYVMEFDLSGYSGLPVAAVEIDVVHSEPSFAASGPVSLDYSADDSTALSSLAFDTSSVGGNNGQLAASDVADWTFNAGNDGATFTYSLSDNGGLFADIESQGIVRLVLEAGAPGTTATYQGFDNNNGGPVLRVTEVPAPGAAGLLGVAGLAAARRRRA